MPCATPPQLARCQDREGGAVAKAPGFSSSDTVVQGLQQLPEPNPASGGPRKTENAPAPKVPITCTSQVCAAPCTAPSREASYRHSRESSGPAAVHTGAKVSAQSEPAWGCFGGEGCAARETRERIPASVCHLPHLCPLKLGLAELEVGPRHPSSTPWGRQRSRLEPHKGLFLRRQGRY